LQQNVDWEPFSRQGIVALEVLAGGVAAFGGRHANVIKFFFKQHKNQ
jgi:hypothetical protein